MNNQNKEPCPICGEGYLTENNELEKSEHNGVFGDVYLYFADCDVCGSEHAGAMHMRKNKRAIISFKKFADGLLTGTELRAIRENLGLSQKMAANLFGGGPVAFSKYENDDVTQSVAMDRLIRLASRSPKDLTLL